MNMAAGLNVPGDSRVRAKRYVPNCTFKVSTKTLGTALTYEMDTRDFSSTGLLLAWDHTTMVPYQVNTLIEMTLDPGSHHLGRSISCLGKVVRLNGDDGSSEFGISIVQMEQEDIGLWEESVDLLRSESIEQIGRIAA